VGEYYLACVVGARPNFMKMAPLLRALERYPVIRPVLIHTGQHYDPSLSDVFFEELGIRRPDAFLDAGSGKQGAQTARVLERCEAVLEAGPSDGEVYDGVVVVGDVNSTMAAALAAAKLGIRVAHVEAGLRSFDRSMPEEINRIVTDSVSELLFVSEPAGLDNLHREGHDGNHVHLAGNTMIDTLLWLLPKARERDALERYDLQAGQYGVVTLHRPGNVDVPEVFSRILDVLSELSNDLPLVFPVHPRTKERLEEFGLADQLDAAEGIRQTPPLGYLDFLCISSQAMVVVTDSGGLQEETTALGIPCLTVRPNTERPITIEEGTSTLVGNDPTALRQCLHEVLAGTYKQGHCPTLWDGRAAERIARILAASLLPHSATPFRSASRNRAVAAGVEAAR
jgi:UDP-N-acetylglucosamine 2-epimerase (non-hydrolysing)